MVRIRIRAFYEGLVLDDSSPALKQFLNFLGERIELKGWKGYRAGLDVSDGHTGQYSYYTKWQGYEVMFHVGPLLPATQNDRQQLERKRHIGNDIVVIIFQDSDIPFKISTLTSKQNHFLAVVKPVNDGYQLVTCYKNGVPAFTPEVPENAYFERTAVARDFFLHKCRSNSFYQQLTLMLTSSGQCGKSVLQSTQFCTKNITNQVCFIVRCSRTVLGKVRMCDEWM